MQPHSGIKLTDAQTSDSDIRLKNKQEANSITRQCNSQPLTSCAGTTNKALQNKVICVDGKKKTKIFILYFYNFPLMLVTSVTQNNALTSFLNKHNCACWGNKGSEKNWFGVVPKVSSLIDASRMVWCIESIRFLTFTLYGLHICHPLSPYYCLINSFCSCLNHSQTTSAGTDGSSLYILRYCLLISVLWLCGYTGLFISIKPSCH